MDYDIPSYHFDLSDNEEIRVMTGERLEKIIGKDIFEIKLESRRVNLTTAQAMLIEQALSQATFDSNIESRVASQTMDEIRRVFPDDPD